MVFVIKFNVIFTTESIDDQPQQLLCEPPGHYGSPKSFLESPFYAVCCVTSHSSCLFFCFSHSLTSFLCLFLDTTFPAASTVGMPFSSHSKYSKVLNISRGLTMARSRSSLSLSASLTSCSSFAFALAVLAASCSARASMSNLSRGRTKAG